MTRETTRSEALRLLTLAWPVMLAHLQWIALNAIDTAMVGHYATDELANLGAARILTWTFFVVMMGLISGVVVFTARADGAKTYDQCGAVFRQGALFAALLGAVGCGLLWLLAQPVLQVTGMAPSMVQGGALFAQVIASGFIANMLQINGNFFLEGISRPRPVMVISLSTLPVNVLMNWLLIYGKFGLPELGATGAAIGTVISVVFGAALTWLYIYRMRDAARYGIGAPGGWRTAWPDGKALRRFGIAPGIAGGFEVGGFSVVSAIGTTLGAVPTAAFQAVVSLHMLSLTLSSGLASAAAVRVGNAVGASELGAIARRGWLAAAMAAGSAALVALLFWLTPGIMLAPFTVDPAMLALGTQMLVVLAPFLLFDGAQMSLLYALRAAGDQVIGGAMQIGAFFVVMCGSAWWFTLHSALGPLGLPLALGLGCLAAFLLMGARFLWICRGQGQFINVTN
jgi:multidrug resistance protein, MATE family